MHCCNAAQQIQQYVSQTLLFVAWLPYCHTRCKHTLAHLTLKKACGEGLHEGKERLGGEVEGELMRDMG